MEIIINLIGSIIATVLGIAAIVLPIVAVVSGINQLKQRPSKDKQDEVSSPQKEEQPKSQYADSYQARYILTKNEWYEYRKLKKLAEGEGLQICPKVRLLDIIEPRSGSNYMSLLGKIQSKHVDFVICDQDLYIKAILELDDNSHNRPDRQERDLFVDEILTSVGYKVIRTRTITENTLDPIKAPKTTEETTEAPKA